MTIPPAHTRSGISQLASDIARRDGRMHALEAAHDVFKHVVSLLDRCGHWFTRNGMPTGWLIDKLSDSRDPQRMQVSVYLVAGDCDDVARMLEACVTDRESKPASWCDRTWVNLGGRESKDLADDATRLRLLGRKFRKIADCHLADWKDATAPFRTAAAPVYVEFRNVINGNRVTRAYGSLERARELAKVHAPFNNCDWRFLVTVGVDDKGQPILKFVD